MKSFSLFLFSLMFLPCCTKMPPFEKAGYTSINKHIQTMRNLENWLPESIGGSFYDDDIKKLTVSFITIAADFNLDHLRSLMIKGIETFLTSINTNEELIPYLNHYPFTYNDLDYGISLYTLDGKWLGFAFLVKGKLSFFEVDEFKHLEKIYEELYPEALQKINASLAIPSAISG